MKKLIILLFLLISTSTLAGADKHTQIFIKVSDVVSIFSKPDYHYQHTIY